MSLIFIFVDGLGLGRNDQWNPLINSGYNVFTKLTGGQTFTDHARPFMNENQLFTAVDSCLGVEGLPQSGTGQVTLFTGINSAKELGRHFGPYPHSSIRDHLGKNSLFQKIQRKNGSCFFINAFPDFFFKKAKNRNRWSCTTLMTQNAGYPLNSVSEVLKEKAITSEFTQKAWKELLLIDVPVISESIAADRVITAANRYDLVLVEYYLTDKAGHRRDPVEAREVLTRLDRFLSRLIERSPVTGHTMLLTSDHGNIEDLSTKSHTRNKVPFFIIGKNITVFHPIRSIQQVTPMCVQWFQSTIGESR